MFKHGKCKPIFCIGTAVEILREIAPELDAMNFPETSHRKIIDQLYEVQGACIKEIAAALDVLEKDIFPQNYPKKVFPGTHSFEGTGFYIKGLPEWTKKKADHFAARFRQSGSDEHLALYRLALSAETRVQSGLKAFLHDEEILTAGHAQVAAALAEETSCVEDGNHAFTLYQHVRRKDQVKRVESVEFVRARILYLIELFVALRNKHDELTAEHRAFLEPEENALKQQTEAV